MLVIRYRRVGKRNYAQYKIVVAEKAFSVKGKFVEALGSYDPHTKEAILKEDRINHWIGVGAQCSDSVHNLLVAKGLIKEAKRKVSFKGKIKEEAVKEENLSTEEAKPTEAVVENSAVEEAEPVIVEPEAVKEEIKVEEKKEEVAETQVKDEMKEEIQKEVETEIDSDKKTEENLSTEEAEPAEK